MTTFAIVLNILPIGACGTPTPCPSPAGGDGD